MLRLFGIFVLDWALATLSLPLSMALRLGWERLPEQTDIVVNSTLAFSAVALPILIWAKLHRISGRFFSTNDSVAILRTAILINLGFLFLMFLWVRLDGVPRSSVAINFLVLCFLLLIPRLGDRLWHERSLHLGTLFTGKAQVRWAPPALIIGVTDVADAFMRVMSRSSHPPYRPVGLLSTTPGPTRGQHVRGISVLGGIDDADAAIESLAAGGRRPEIMIIADPELRGEKVARLLKSAEAHSIKLRRLPEISRLEQASPGAFVAKPIEVEDLLARPQALLNAEEVKGVLGGKRILVTGAGGSIGSEIVHQVAALSPSHLTLIDNSEFNLYEIDRQLGERLPDISRASLLCDIRDRERIERVIATERPDFVFHAAALKHVPLLEAQPAQAVLTNIQGTRNVADAARAHRVGCMIMISTDKAASPVSVMGTSKRIAERYCQALDIEGSRDAGTRFLTVRFGNVLGSAGSVVPLFQKQLATGGPLTVTHPDMERFFMTIREAVQLVLQSVTLQDKPISNGGAVVILDMGKPVKIIEMAEQMIRLAGLVPYDDVNITFTGLRPGERLHETLLSDEETLLPSSHQGLLIARPQTLELPLVVRLIDRLVAAARQDDANTVRELMDWAIAGEKGVVETATSDRNERTAQ